MKGATPDETVVFMHVPKTAGSTVRWLLGRYYHPDRRYAVPINAREIPPLEEIVADLRALPEERLSELDLVTGHFPFGIHTVLPRPARYVTFVRDPVERIASAYHYLRVHPYHPLREQAARLTLREFAERNVSGNLHNGQTAFIAGKGIWHDRFDDELLEEALANIEKRFAVVGVTERFDESVLLLRRQLGWRSPIYYRSQNVNPERPRRELDPETRATLEMVSRLDRKLYEHANTLLDAELNRAGVDLRSELLALRARSYGYRLSTDANGRIYPLLRPAQLVVGMFPWR